MPGLLISNDRTGTPEFNHARSRFGTHRQRLGFGGTAARGWR